MIEETLDQEVELIKDPEIIEKKSKKIFSVLQTKDETNIISEFYNKEYKNIDLTLCINNSHNDNTILTTLVNFNLTRAACNFITTIKSYSKPPEEIIAYINKKNSKGYNALLYSAFRGNLEIFKKLMENGADISITNSSGLNSLHLAAQGNYPNIIIFLLEKYKLDINSKDNKGNSALHWAVYSNKKQAVDYLIYYNIDVNLKDNDGDTALQIALRKGDQNLIQKLRDDYCSLLDKTIEEKDVNNDTNEENSSGIFNELLKKFMGGNITFSFLVILIVLEGFNQIIILLGYNNFFMSFVFILLFSMLIFFYFVSSKSDPGYVINKCINSLLLLAEQGEDMKNVCPWCINYINEKTYHCFKCKKCIAYQQFHDVYINNCVGRFNFSLYMSFLYCLGINSCFKLIISLWGLFWLKGSNLKRVVFFIILQVLAVSLCITFCVLKIRAKIAMYNSINYLKFSDKDNNKENIDYGNSISTSNSVKKNLNNLNSFD